MAANGDINVWEHLLQSNIEGGNALMIAIHE